MKSLYDPTREEISEILHNEPRYRVDQLWSGLYQHFHNPADISTLPLSVRTRVIEELPPGLVEIKRVSTDNGDTVKFLWHLVDGNYPIETVLMFYRDRATVCVSTQAGCAMGCGFCATGQAGFHRHLSVGEIVEQVVRTAHEAHSRDRRIDNIVFMGMGEPLANEAAVWGAVERIHGDIGISARHITISTVGIIPGIRTLATRPLPVNLAVSLHGARDELRNELVPINQRYPIADLVAACQDYLAAKRRRVTFEWALIDGVNDTDRDAHELADICDQLSPSAHVNLIPLNPTPGWPTVGSPPHKVAAFEQMLRRLGVNATTRQNRGTDIAAACGQLAAGQPVALRAKQRQI
ncbi:MAG: ribosomal large subunit methyltransferase [Actinomycetota bacterium]